MYAVEHFTINANRFPAFANYKSDIEGYTVIYKQNDSTGNVSPYRAIGWDFNRINFACSVFW